MKVKFSRRRSIARNLSLIVSVSIIAIFVIFGALFYSYTSNIFVQKIKDENTIKVESIAKDINNIFNNAILITQQMANNRQIKDYIRSTSNRWEITSNPLYKDVVLTLKGAKVSSNLYNAVWAGNEKASFYIDNNQYITDENYHINLRPWYSVAVNSRGVAFTSPYIDYSTKKIVVSAVEAVREDNKIIGFVGIDIFLDSIPKIFQGTRIGLRGKNFLITDGGSYIYRDDKAIKTMENIGDSGDELKDMALKLLMGKEKFREIKYQNENYYLVNCPVKNIGWTVISLINKNEALGGLRLFTFKMGMLVISAILALILFLIIIVNKSTKPISTITEYAEEIADGDFDKSLPEQFLKRHDEIGDLSKAFQIITEAFRKENIVLEEKIQEKNRELQEQYNYILETEKMASLGSLVAGVAHEINTPLGIGITAVSYMEKINDENRKNFMEGTLTKSGLNKFMDDINESITMLKLNLGRAADLVKSFKKVAVDQVSEEMIKFSLKENIEAVVLSMKHEYKNTNHKIYIDCPENITLDSYPGAFSQIFTNLIMNSLAHGFKGRTEGNMNITVVLHKDKLRIVYSDDGIGIPKENVKKIFEPFFTTNRLGGSSGLGMPIVHNIVSQQLRGNIHYEYNGSHGVKFVIEIPRKNIM